jgi:hypothetical protein
MFQIYVRLLAEHVARFPAISEHPVGHDHDLRVAGVVWQIT